MTWVHLSVYSVKNTAISLVGLGISGFNAGRAVLRPGSISMTMYGLIDNVIYFCNTYYTLCIMSLEIYSIQPFKGLTRWAVPMAVPMPVYTSRAFPIGQHTLDLDLA